MSWPMTISDVDQFLSALHFVVACEFLKNAIVDVNIAPKYPNEFLRILKSC